MQTQQTHQLERVQANLATLVLDWCERKGPGHVFHLAEFTRDILNQVLCSPTSPFRILAHLRQRGHVNYVVLNRAASLYRLEPLEETDPFLLLE